MGRTSPKVPKPDEKGHELSKDNVNTYSENEKCTSEVQLELELSKTNAVHCCMVCEYSNPLSVQSAFKLYSHA